MVLGSFVITDCIKKELDKFTEHKSISYLLLYDSDHNPKLADSSSSAVPIDLVHCQKEAVKGDPNYVLI